MDETLLELLQYENEPYCRALIRLKKDRGLYNAVAKDTGEREPIGYGIFRYSKKKERLPHLCDLPRIDRIDACEDAIHDLLVAVS